MNGQSRQLLWVLVVSVFLLVTGTTWAADRTPVQGAGAVPTAPVAVDNDMDGFFTPADCNDNDPDIFPGAPEKCNGVDDDCDGLGDENFPELGDPCTVGIGECENSGTLQCLMDGSGTACSVSPLSPTAEVCDGLDNDCNGFDDAGNPGVGGQESDGDGDLQWECQGDCDDADPDNYSGNIEICDGQDNDCTAAFGTSTLGTNGWYSDDTRADGAGPIALGTNLRSDTLTDDPEATASGTPTHDADITRQIEFVTAPGTVPAGTHPYAAHLSIVAGAGSGKSQMSHRKDDGVGHAAGSVFGSGFFAEYSWMANGTISVTPSLKFGIKTADFGSTGISGRTGENVWDKVLIYEPGNLNGGTADGLWHTETLSYTTGKWWFFDRTAGAGTIGMPLTLSDMSTSSFAFSGAKTIADVYALITAPGAHITSVQFGIGSGNAGGNVYVNQLETNFYRAGDVTTFGGPVLGDPGADFPGETTDADGDGVVACLDCDDMDPANYPGNTEVCDGQDNDCDTFADFPGETTDLDGDLALTCADCDDMDPANYPGNTEVCDGQDNDCDTFADFPGETTDADGDLSLACVDCDDADPTNYPGNIEICDGQDNDCNNVPDNGLADADGDAIGDTCDLCPQDPGGLAVPTVWEQGFETDTAGWLDQDDNWSGDVVRLVSGTDGIASSDGSGYHANFTQNDVNQSPGDYTGPFTRFDGYRGYWPGGFTALVDVYLDTAWAAGEGFDYSVAASTSSGGHLRDFIFHVTKDTSTGTLLVGASNNTNFDPREDLETINHVEVTTSGWYTLRHVFRDQNGVLAVDLQLLDSLGTVLFTETRSTVADVIATQVGGNRYGWFTNIDIAGGIEVDDHRLILGTGDADGDGVCDSDDVCAGGDDNVDGDGDGVAAFCDCDDADDTNYPGNTEICDGQDNDCSATYGTSSLGTNGWYSDDTRADGAGPIALGTNLRSDTLTDDPEATASGTPTHDADITRQIEFVTAPGTVPAGTHPYAAHLSIVAGAGAGKSQMSHRKDDGVGHAPGSVFGPGFFAEYSWMANGTISVTPSLKFGIKTADFATTGISGRTGENAWDKVLIYEPGNLNGGTADGLWHTETLSYTTGKWWFFDRRVGAGTIGMPLTLSDMSTSSFAFSGAKTIADVYALITAPGAHITSVQFGIGSGNAGGNVYVNQLETNFYRPGDVTTFGGPLSGADFPGESTDGDGDTVVTCLDCDDMDPDNYPGNTEICDGQDNDCDLIVPVTEIDNDGDLQAECEGDCDDADAARFAGNTEICDGLDNDCDLIVPVTEIDDDGDFQAECEGDCDDTEPLVYTGNLEVCGDGLDNDCDLFVDGGNRYVTTTGSDAANDCTAVGTPCLTVQHAVDQACDNDTIEVAAGTYPGTVDIDKPVTVSCANAGIPWNGVRGAETVLDGSAVPAVLDISASDVTIDGCEIKGGASTYVGVQLYNGSTNILDVSVVNNLIHGMRLPNPFAAFSDLAYGVFAVTGAPGARYEVRGLSIQGNDVYDIGVFGVCGGTGAYLNHVIGASPGDGVTVTGNRFREMKTGPGAFDLGTGLVVDAGADNGVGTPTAPSSGALVTGNLYDDLVGGAAMFTDDSTFDEAHASFTDVTYFMLNIFNLGTLATVNEAALAPYARTNDPLSPVFVPGSYLYSPTVQTAVDFSDPLATIDVTAGTFTEQVDVPKSVQIVGSGEASTTIEAPATLVNDALFGQKTIVAIHGAGVSTELTGVTVAGPGPSGCGSLHYGVLVYGGAHANIHDNTISDVRDEPLSGCQNGVAIRVGSDLLATTGTADVVNNTLSAYQKNGFVIDGVGTSATITGNDVLGVGATPLIAQNGIQISRGAVGTASTNTITGHLCDAGSCGPSGFQSIGVLLFDAGGGVALTDNVVDDNDLGIYNYSRGLTTMTDNDVTANRYVGLFLEEGQAQAEDNTIDSGTQTAVWLYAFSGVTGDSVATLLRNTITNAENGVLLGDDDTGDAFDPLLVANFNHIFGHTTLGMDNQGAAVTANATCNWWGAADGPGPVGPGTGDGISTGVDATTWLLFADFGVDTDGDMFTSCTSDTGGDCDVATADVYPGAPQICDGLNNDCSDPFWPTVAEGTGAANETDGDGDLQSECGGDCNDLDGTIFVGAFETCDTTDNDCDTVLNNGGADADCDAGIVCQLDSCSSLGACEFVASGDCGVAGNVYYYDVVALADVADLAKPVEDVTVDATGDTIDTDDTDNTGLYELVNAAGTVTATPSRIADANDLAALSSQDAALIAQRAVSLVSFSPLQADCGDVSNNSTITSFDASLVAQKVVNPFVVLPAAAAAGQDWVFDPMSRSYSPISVDETGEDYIGCVFGDVTNSWALPGPSASVTVDLGDEASGGSLVAISAAGEEAAGAEAVVTPSSFERVRPAVLYLDGGPELNEDGSYTYTLGLEDADGIVAVDLELVYQPGQVELVEVRTVGIGVGLQSISHERADEGRAAIAVYGVEALEGTGSFLELTVRLGAVPAGFPFKLNAQANEQLIPLRWGIDLEPVAQPEEVAPGTRTDGQLFDLGSK